MIRRRRAVFWIVLVALSPNGHMLICFVLRLVWLMLGDLGFECFSLRRWTRWVAFFFGCLKLSLELNLLGNFVDYVFFDENVVATRFLLTLLIVVEPQCFICEVTSPFSTPQSLLITRRTNVLYLLHTCKRFI